MLSGLMIVAIAKPWWEVIRNV